jgi:hypothetical protein
VIEIAIPVRFCVTFLQFAGSFNGCAIDAFGVGAGDDVGASPRISACLDPLTP